MYRIVKTKEFVEREEYIDSLEKGINDLKREIVILKERLGDPIEVVKAITKDRFKFFDYLELPADKRKNYSSQAKIILDSDAFKNEISSLLTTWQEWAAKESKNYDGVVAMRHQMSGILLLIERLEEIVEPKEVKPTNDDPYAPL